MTAQSTMEETIRWAVDALDSPMDRSLIADRLKEALQAAPPATPPSDERADRHCPAATVSEDDLVASMTDRWVHEKDARSEARAILARFTLTDKRPPSMQEDGK